MEEVADQGHEWLSRSSGAFLLILRQFSSSPLPFSFSQSAKLDQGQSILAATAGSPRLALFSPKMLRPVVS